MTSKRHSTRLGIFLPAAVLSIIVPACAFDGEDVEETSPEAAIQARATAELQAQAAAGNRGAQEVLRGMERFRQLHPELAEDGTAALGERDSAIVAAMKKRQESGQLAVGTLCDTQWRTVIHGQTSLKLYVARDLKAYVRPMPPGDGGRELFLFCRDDRWSSNHHLIWANAGGYLTFRGAGRVRILQAGELPAGVGIDELFDIRNLDSSWSYFMAVFAEYHVAPLSGGNVWAEANTPLNGNALWRCTPGRCTDRFGR